MSDPSSSRVDLSGLHQRVAKGELTPEEATIIAEFANLRFEKVKFIVSMLAVIATLAAILYTSSSPSEEVEGWKAKYLEELGRSRAGCVAVDETHELCEKRK